MKERNELASMLGRMLADKNFFQLDQKVRAPNMFSILHMEHNRSAYTNVLAYLLNPNENHGLEDAFLRVFLARALQASEPAEGEDPPDISPIPYDKVREALMDWDELDALSADLRETMVVTNYPLGSTGYTADICIWNDAYSFVIYVENFIVPRSGWGRYHGTGEKVVRSRMEQYVLEMYREWAGGDDEEDSYSILPVFMAPDGELPSERYVTRTLDYQWMTEILETLSEGPTVTSHARTIINDFCELLRRRLPERLDPYGMGTVLDSLYQEFGPVIARLYDHVAECKGCDTDDELIIAYHDVYRRHRHTIDTLWQYVDTRRYPIIDEVAFELANVLDPNRYHLFMTSSTVSLVGHRWLPEDAKADENVKAPLEVYFSASTGVAGIIMYQDWDSVMARRILAYIEENAEEHSVELLRSRPSPANFHISKKFYKVFVPIDIAADLMRYFELVDMAFTELTR